LLFAAPVTKNFLFFGQRIFSNSHPYVECERKS
jgi:hypothetical protein